jgi:hypothetical protein
MIATEEAAGITPRTLKDEEIRTETPEGSAAGGPSAKVDDDDDDGTDTDITDADTTDDDGTDTGDDD